MENEKILPLNKGRCPATAGRKGSSETLVVTEDNPSPCYRKDLPLVRGGFFKDVDF